MTDARAAAERAISLLQEKGWHKGDAVGPDGSLCLASALSMAEHATLRALARCWHQALDVIRREFPERLPGDHQTIAGFNDDPRTTKEDVLLVLKHMTEEA